jgi:hypothetical protein
LKELNKELEQHASRMDHEMHSVLKGDNLKEYAEFIKRRNLDKTAYQRRKEKEELDQKGAAVVI